MTRERLITSAAAVMRRHELSRILTFDRGFDPVDGVERVL